MIKNELFFHYQTPHGRSLGFSALMKQDPNNPLVAQVAITRCNKHDKAFNKKIAREVLRSRVLQQIPLRDLPTLLAQHAALCGESVDRNSFGNILRKFL